MEVCISVTAKFAEYLVDPILCHARYLFCFNTFAQDFQNVKKDLELTQESVRERARRAINRTEKIEPKVEKWLKDVENVLDEVQKLEEKINEPSKWFKNGFRYFLAREVARKTKKMIELNNDSKFDPFSQVTELPGMTYFSSKDFVLFKSTESVFKKLLEAVKDNINNGMIGLHGMGGSGKTTLVKEVGKKAEELKLFDKVVMTTVSQTPNVRAIQDQISDQLGLKLEEQSEFGRAQRLSQRLRNGSKTLVILDDVWEKLDFEAIGIPPLNEDDTGCIILLTTRSREICASMECQTTIELGLLDEEEAWTLFKHFASIADHEFHADLEDLGRKIADECKGLPIAIVTVGSSLRGKSQEEWGLALSRLRDSQPMDVPKGLRSPYACLKLSYDNLTSEAAKNVFLLCSIFPEDHEIGMEKLVRFGKGLGLVGTIGTMEKARKEMHVAVNILMDSCLLLQVDNRKGYVKMHDMVRDVALWIASEKGQTIFVETGMDPRMLAEKTETLIEKSAISLWDLKNGHLPADQLNFPRLNILLLHCNRDSWNDFEVPDAFLEGMKKLKTLAFTTFAFEWLFPFFWTSEPVTMSIPLSIKSLTSLQTLCLRGYKLGDISVLGSLKGLEILDLRGSSFKELPDSIAALKKLKVLDLYFCKIWKNDNAYEVIGRCSRLEELYLHLRNTVHGSLEQESFKMLTRYCIVDSTTFYYGYSIFKYFEKHGLSRALSIEGFNVSASSSIKDLCLRSEWLHLRNLKGGYKNLIPSMDEGGMNHLSCLILEKCAEIACLVHTTGVTPGVWSQTEAVFSKLVTLILKQMYDLEQVFHDPSSCCSLKKLEEISIKSCSTLHSISFPRNSNLCGLKILKIEDCQMLSGSLFTPVIAQTLGSLEELKIVKCSKLRHIITQDCEEEEEEGDVQKISSMVIPNLRILEVRECEKLETILPMTYSQGLVRLEEMKIENNGELKYVFGTEKEHDQLQLHQNFDSKEPNIEMNLLALRTLSLFSLPNLTNIWPETCHPRYPNLKVLQCWECPRLSGTCVRKATLSPVLQLDIETMEKDTVWVIDTNVNQMHNQTLAVALQVVLNWEVLILSHQRVGGILDLQLKGQLNNNSKNKQPLSSQLRGLVLSDLPDLTFIWKGPTHRLSLHKLSYVEVDKCPKLKAIFSSTIVKSLPMLTRLEIRDCEELEQIFVSDDDDVAAEDPSSSQQAGPCFPQLYYIEVVRCNNLRWLFFNLMASHFPNLVTLDVRECSRLEKAFAFENEAEDGGAEVMFQNLETLILTSLPNFTQVHRGLKFQRMERFEIVDCPMYSPTTQ